MRNTRYPAKHAMTPPMSRTMAAGIWKDAGSMK
jgi:hypothetical protein